jgi:hypothetical protein
MEIRSISLLIFSSIITSVVFVYILSRLLHGAVSQFLAFDYGDFLAFLGYGDFFSVLVLLRESVDINVGTAIVDVQSLH